MIKLALVLVIIFHVVSSPMPSDTYCKIDIVDSSIRQPYSGRRCLESLDNVPPIQIAYEINSTYYCLEPCYCNSTDKSHISINNTKTNQLLCPTLIKASTSTKCNCCSGYTEDKHKACVPIEEITPNFLADFIFSQSPHGTVRFTKTNDDLPTPNFAFESPGNREFKIPSSSSLSLPPPVSSSSQQPIILLSNFQTVLLIVFISTSLSFLLIIIGFLSCCFCPFGLLAKKRRQQKEKNKSGEFMKTAEDNVYVISNDVVKIHHEGIHGNGELEDNKQNEEAILETVKVVHEEDYDHDIVYSVIY